MITDMSTKQVLWAHRQGQSQATAKQATGKSALELSVY